MNDFPGRLPIDQNRRNVIGGVSSADGVTILPAEINPATGGLIVDASLTPSGTQDVNLTKIGGASFALGQQLAAASLPVVLTAAQISTLTPLSTIAVTQSTSPWVTSTALPSALVAFVTTITTAGTRVQLASNSLSQGVVVEAPSTNTGVIYVGGSNVSSTVYGAELQPGQSTGIAVNNTNLIWADTASNGNKVAVIGS